jgi:hypothetical protein
MWLTAEYSEERSAAAAVAGLRDARVEDVELFSDKPVELIHRRSRASLIAVLGAIVNGSLATAFIYFAQHNYPLVTGGMPIFSPWATGVITYELTMAGAMAGVVIAFLWESGLLRRRRGPAPPVLKDGAIFVRVRCAPEAAGLAAECLSRSGAVAIARADA